jgi:nucleoside-diphosphate-sugar epimerase
VKVAVTGGSGQLGALVLKRLIDERAVARVVDLDRVPPPLVSGKLEYRPLDVRDRGALDAALNGCDALMHLAFAVTVKLPRAEFDAVNVGGSEHVFRAAVAAGIRRMVYVSSIAAYGVVPGHPRPIVESTPRILQDDFPYAAAKYRVEEFLDAFEEEHPEVRIARLRPSVLIGRRFGNPLAAALGAALGKGKLPVSSSAPVGVVWDEDVADAAVAALLREAHGAFNLCAAEQLPPAEIAARIGLRPLRVTKPLLWLSAALTSLRARLGRGEAVDPSWARQRGVAMIVSSERAREELGWQPRCPTCVGVFRRYLEVAPGRDRRAADFFRFLDRAARRGPARPGASGTQGPVHLCLTGPGGGDFILLVEDGRLSIREGVPRPPKSSATMTADLWRGLLLGTTSVPTAQLTGKIRLDGDPSAGFLIPGIVHRVRQESAAEGLSGRVLRSRLRRLTGGEPA